VPTRSLFLVTENYHMPRALIEVRRAVGDVEIIPYPVRQAPYLQQQWWRDERAVRGLFLEYTKYLLAQVRQGAPPAIAEQIRAPDAAAQQKGPG
jgi:uncharacterized SAM-binding protein YcdF (DUF218 family)